MEIKYQEHDINGVFQFFVNAYELKPGQTLANWTANYDPHTGKVIFKLYIEGNE